MVVPMVAEESHDAKTSASSPAGAAKLEDVMIIEGDAGSGTGFMVREGEKLRLYTAAHVFAGNKKLAVKSIAGRQFKKFGAFEVASDADMARLEIAESYEGGYGLAKKGAVQAEAEVLCVGNSGGAGVLTFLRGEVLSVGPLLVEVSNEVIQGNSGGPVIDAKSGAVVGLVTHLTAGRDDLWAKDTKFSEVRRFAARLDRDVAWESVPIGKFLTEARLIEDYNTNSRILSAISVLNPSQEGLRLDVRVTEGGPTLLQFFQANEKNPVVAELITMNSKLGDKRLATSEKDLRSKYSSFYFSAMSRLNQGADQFDPDKLAGGYHRAAGKQASEWRKEAMKVAKQVAESYR